MFKRKKVYCEECKYYSAGRGKRHREQCLAAETITVPNTGTYLHRCISREQYCWEKNEKNNCLDYETNP